MSPAQAAIVIVPVTILSLYLVWHRRMIRRSVIGESSNLVEYLLFALGPGIVATVFGTIGPALFALILGALALLIERAMRPSYLRRLLAMNLLPLGSFFAASFAVFDRIAQLFGRVQ